MVKIAFCDDDIAVVRQIAALLNKYRETRDQPEGFHIPLAPGRTFCPQRVMGLSAGGPLSLSPWDGHTLSDRRAVHL